MDSTIALLLAVLLLFGNGFFVAAEFAIISARRSSIEPKALEGSKRAKITLQSMENVTMMLAGAQLGITLCSLGLGALGEPAIAYFLEAPLHALHIPHSLLHPISFVIALTIMTFLHVVIGEMVPKNITLAHPDRTALLFAPPLKRIVSLLGFVIVGLNSLANHMIRWVGIEPKAEVASTFTRDEVAGLVEESRREGLLSEEKEHLVSGTLRFDTRTARHILLPKEKVMTISKNSTNDDVEQLVAQTGYSRFPISHKDEFIGYVHVKDVLEVESTGTPIKITPKMIREMATIKETDSLRKVLASMQQVGAHIGLVKDAKGKVLGVVTLEDALEELVGEIMDDSQKRQLVQA